MLERLKQGQPFDTAQDAVPVGQVRKPCVAQPLAGLMARTELRQGLVLDRCAPPVEVCLERLLQRIGRPGRVRREGGLDAPTFAELA